MCVFIFGLGYIGNWLVDWLCVMGWMVEGMGGGSLLWFDDVVMVGVVVVVVMYIFCIILLGFGLFDCYGWLLYDKWLGYLFLIGVYGDVCGGWVDEGVLFNGWCGGWIDEDVVWLVWCVWVFCLFGIYGLGCLVLERVFSGVVYCVDLIG